MGLRSILFEGWPICPRLEGRVLSKRIRIVWVTAVAAATLVYTFWGSQLQLEDLIIRINFWSLISIPLILGFGIWWIRKAGI
jgi:hypothetical protein